MLFSVAVPVPVVPVTETSNKEWLTDVSKWAFCRLRNIFLEDMKVDRLWDNHDVNPQEQEKLEMLKDSMIKKIMEVVMCFSCAVKAVMTAGPLSEDEEDSLTDEVNASFVLSSAGEPDWINDFKVVMGKGITAVTKELDGKIIPLHVVDL